MRQVFGMLLLCQLLSYGQTVVNGGRIYLGSQDASQAKSTAPARTGQGAPTGTCVPGQLYYQLNATPGQNLWGCTASGWSVQTGTASTGPASVTRVNQYYAGPDYSYAHDNSTPSVERIFSDGSQAQTGWVNEFGGLTEGQFHNTNNWQTQGKITVALKKLAQYVGAGQTNLFAAELHKYGPGDGAIIDGILSCFAPGNTSGDEGCTALRVAIQGSGFMQVFDVLTPGASSCSATLAQNITPMITNDPASATGVLAQTVSVGGAMTGCKVGDWVAFDYPATLATENALAQQDGHNMEMVKLTAVDPVNHTLTGYFKGFHGSGSTIAGAPWLPSDTSLEFDRQMQNKALLVNVNPVKIITPPQGCTVSQPGTNSNSFKLDAGCSGFTFDATAMGGNSSFPGFCIAVEQDHGFSFSVGMGYGGTHELWHQIVSVSPDQVTSSEIGHPAKIDHSRFRLFPCKSVEQQELGTVNGLPRLVKAILHPQPLGTVNGINYDFAAGDQMIVSAAAVPVDFAHMILQNYHYSQGGGAINFVADGAGTSNGIRWVPSGPFTSAQVTKGNFASSKSITISPVYAPQTAGVYFYTGSNQSGAMSNPQPTCYQSSGAFDPFPWGSPTTSATANAGATTLALRNLWSGTLVSGAQFAYNGTTYTLTADVTISNGTATVTFAPPLATGVSANVGLTAVTLNPAVSLTCTFATAQSGSFVAYHDMPQFATMLNMEGDYNDIPFNLSGRGVPKSHNGYTPDAIHFHSYDCFDPNSSCYDGKPLAWQDDHGNEYRLGNEAGGIFSLRYSLDGRAAFRVQPSTGPGVSPVMQVSSLQVLGNGNGPGCAADIDRGKLWIDNSSGSDLTKQCVKVNGILGWITRDGLNLMSFSATPTFDTALGKTQSMTLTGNVTGGSVTHLVDGQELTFVICQDAVGGRTMTWPANVHGGLVIGTTANTCSTQSFASRSGNLYATGLGVINQ